MRYFMYQPEGINFTLIGTDRKQIRNTLGHYDLPVPAVKDIREVPKVTVMCAIGSPSTPHFLLVEVMDRFFFEVHVTAFNYIRKMTENFEELKRGDLYKFDTGRKDYGIVFLPECVMLALKNYGWSRHEEQVANWMESDQKSQPYADKTGKFVME